jgi:hypothetical protein
MRASGASAVMADRARGEVKGDDAQAALWRRLDFFPTPPWAARAGGELIARLDPEARTAWEPACGAGHMAFGLKPYFEWVCASDIHWHGYQSAQGEADFLDPALEKHQVRDLMEAASGEACEPDWIITNPPFASAAEFVRLGLQRARRGVAMLCRLSWIESAGRYPLFFGETPLTVFAPFAERVPMTLGRWDPKASTATGYAWFLWMHPPALVAAAQACRAISPTTPVILPIPPGTKARLTRATDARLFGAVAADGGLFSASEAADG